MRKRVLLLASALAVSLVGVGCFAACGKTKELTFSATPTAKSGLSYTGRAQELITAGAVENGTIYYKLGNGEWSENVPKATNAGAYEISYKVEANEGYVSIEETSLGTVRISKGKISHTAPVAAENLTYTGSPQELVTGGAVAGDIGTIEYSLNDGETWANKALGINAGSYTVYYQITTDNQNYNNVAKTQVGSSAIVIAKANMEEGTHYTTPTQISGLCLTGGSVNMVNAGSVQANIAGAALEYSTDNENWDTEVPQATAAGSYTVYWRIAGATNYNDVSGQIAVTVSSVHYTPPEANTALTAYTGNAQQLITRGTAQDDANITVKYSLNESAEDADWKADIQQITATDAGTYTVYYRVYDENDALAVSGSVEAIIEKANLTYTAPTAITPAPVYNGNAQQLIEAGSATGGTVWYLLDGGTWTQNVAEITGTAVGNYNVSYKIVPNDETNYNGVAETAISGARIAKTTNNISFTFSGTAHCHDTIDESAFSATADFGTVTYSYSLDGETYYTLAELQSMGYVLNASQNTTVYVKASVAETDDYDANSVTQQITVAHNYTTWDKTSATQDVKKCVCGAAGEPFNKVVSITNPQHVVLDLNTDGTVNETQTQSILLTGVSTYSKVVSISFGDETLSEANSLTFNVKKIGKAYGDATLTVVVEDSEQEQHTISVPVVLVTKILTDKAHLTALLPMALACEDADYSWGGYFELGGPIDYDGDYYDTFTPMSSSSKHLSETGGDWTNGFKGVFDGCGNTISNIQFGTRTTSSSSIWHAGNSLLVGLNGGTVKNVAFTGVNLVTKASVIANWGHGTIQNVYMQIAKAHSWGASDSNPLSALPAHDNAINITVENTIIDISNTQYVYGSGNGTAAATMSNFVLFGKRLTLDKVYVIGYNKEHPTISVSEYLDSVNGTYDSYTTYNAMYYGLKSSQINLGSWDSSSLWSAEQWHIPHCEAMGAIPTPTFTQSATVIGKGGSATFVSDNNGYVALSSEAESAGITVANGVVTVPDNAALVGQTYAVKAYSIFGTSVAATANFEVITGVLANQVVLDVDVTTTGYAGSGDFTVDFTSIYTGSATNVPVYVDGTPVSGATATVVNGVATFAKSQFAAVWGEHEVALNFNDSGNSVKIAANALFVTKMIANQSDMRNIKTYSNLAKFNGGGYYMLSQNVQLVYGFATTNTNAVDDFRIGAADGVPFVGVLDGNGYAVDKLIVSSPYNYEGQWGAIQNLGEAGVIKNISFTNVCIGGKSKIVAAGNGTLENVSIKISVLASNTNGVYDVNRSAQNIAGINVLGTGVTNIKLKNVVVDLTGSNLGTEYTKGYMALFGTIGAGATVENVAVFGLRSKADTVDGRVVNGEHSSNGVNEGVYVTFTGDAADASTDNGVAFPATGWDSTYWTVDSDAKTVTFNAKS